MIHQNGCARQNSQDPHQQLNEPITEPELIWQVYFITNRYGLGHNVFLADDEVPQYNANPDLFVAKYLGFATVDEYYEYVDACGAPQCSNHTKVGRPCRNSIGCSTNPAEWRERHRSAPCFVHGGRP
jgi:hypothetical protein